MIGILVVSHSPKAAQGISEIASAMSQGSVPVVGVGGSEDGGLGTSVPAIYEALTELLDRCDGVVVVPDLGSAVLSARAALEMLPQPDRVVIADGPVLEGAMMGAVQASVGSGLDEVARTVFEARNLEKSKR
ncbi:dihydroxyacetone kinase phosphoryl donor subunit DhaM [Thermanaerovibrio acidaminovorans]|jgi:dihydroxyacetone kinase phosphotransfer subunit|uniref:phosphoenolpyruvate--glycerone phosphotransferase n=1 Tax=Thermanaerovibrio acidaminovorans (strain ATCC 49978 / DSM 6589 / Su883) TaxID=525903 RepID=D1B6Y4_THEAS|nr:dihydroxyacetone kinase phosphoryl donor subunit DhaM [Thermanaerovibrio acidaminovorans]ACZ19775.1 dihydroxyacetone kinase, phosphotransfer subunit [Thermanaerovibrio acidaminovorans DSM 6589]